MVSALVFISLILDIFRISFFKDKDHHIVSCRFDEKQNTASLHMFPKKFRALLYFTKEVHGWG